MPGQQSGIDIVDWTKLWKPWHVVMRKTRKRGYIPRSDGLHGFQADPQLLHQWFGGCKDGMYQWMITGPCGENPELVYVGTTASSLKDALCDYTRSNSHVKKNINQALEENLQLHARVLLRSDTTAPDAGFMKKMYMVGHDRPKWNRKR